MKIGEVRNGLAALMFYQSPAKAEGSPQFEDLTDADKKPFFELAQSVLVNLDKLNLTVVDKKLKTNEQVDALLRDRIEAEIKSFFAGLTVIKKGAIPEQELVSRIWGVWKNL